MLQKSDGSQDARSSATNFFHEDKFAKIQAGYERIFCKGLIIIIIIIVNGGILSLTDSHHHHHGQIPTMVGICHGGNLPLGHYYYVNSFRGEMYFVL